MISLLPHALDNTAESFPDREAVCFYDERLSYAELALRSHRLARLLVDQGVRRGDRVGICLGKGTESAVAMYGIMKAGAAYVPLDTSAPVARLASVIRDCGIRHMITNETKRNVAVALAAAETSLECIIGLDAPGQAARYLSWDAVAATPPELPDAGTTEQDLAYIIYTSGSTGVPKGIMHTHYSGLSFARWAVDTYSLSGHDRLTNHAPLHFDLSTLDFFGASVAGGTTIVVPEEAMKLPASYSKLLQDERISVFYTVPFALIQLLTRGTLHTRRLDSLRWILFAGDVCPTKYVRALMLELPHTGFSNIYGPAETNGCTYYNVPDLPDPDKPLPIGRACDNMETLIVDGEDRLVAPGEPGELLVRGPTTMLGYWERPDLNEQAFWHQPMADDASGQRSGDEAPFYRTGDLVQLLPDGNLAFLGRKDRQIKVRGYRVELDEIEAALSGHETVEEGAVFPVTDAEGTTRIEAAAILKQESAETERTLSRYLKARLPWYAIPARIEIASHFPRTSTGKIDRLQLRKQAEKHPAFPSS